MLLTYQANRRLIKSGCLSALILLLALMFSVEAKDHKTRDQLQKGQNLCIARFESTTGEPLYYTCPRPNESEKKSYCCYLDKCCDYKEFQKQTEQQFKNTQAVNFGYMSKNAIGGVLKVLLWIVFFIILLIVGCCCLVFFMCRKRKLFSGSIFNTPLPTQPPGVNIYQRPNQPYDIVDTIGPPGPAPAVPPPSYPSAYPAYPPYPSGPQQPPFNPNYK
jgi:hypothetical protein